MDFNTLRLMMGASGGAEKTYVEDVFSTWLYTGNGSTQTITNGIDLSGEGGLVWFKYRDGVFGDGHYLYDTARGAGRALQSNHTYAETAVDSRLTAFTSTGFTLDTTGGGAINQTSYNYASWTFRKAAKFFDVVTYTGTGSARTVAHNLGSAPGTIIIKRTDAIDDWLVYHRSIGATKGLYLNDTSGEITASTFFNNTEPTSTVFTVGTNTKGNASGGTYVAYLFAHDAGGFGDSGNDSVVKCGSFTANNGNEVNVSLGWEPQWVLWKRATDLSDWTIFDNMRNMSVTGSDRLYANLSNAEASSPTYPYIKPNSTGFSTDAWGGTDTIIYIAIRRGPMKTPTDATKVFSAVAYSGDNSGARYVSDYGFPLDLLWYKRRNGTDFSAFSTRLTGGSLQLVTSSTAAESNLSNIQLDRMLGFYTTSTYQNAINETGATIASGGFRRAPGFFDVVAWTGTGAPQAYNHSLGVVPELMIQKRRDFSGAPWIIYSSTLGNTKRLYFDTAAAVTDTSIWDSTTPSSTTFTTLGGSGGTNISYLFATCPGVSKVGSYTGSASDINVDCGFTNGARFVLIKRVSDTGAWFVWDTARGIASGNDPYLLLNSTAAEVTNTDYLDPYSAGFTVPGTSVSPGVNNPGDTFIFLAIA